MSRTSATVRHVRVLPTALSDQIAAGEVIERPASVVKELLENALDAGATRVDIDVDGGGITVIRVADDGLGMSRRDATTAVLRHATSKIATAEDLAAIRTLGFRGEALPSIAAVSRLRIATRTRDATEGSEVMVEGGAEASVAPAAGAAGTIVEVKDLFYNTPARRKFLRGEVSERRAVVDVVTRAALVRPDVGFALRFDAREVLSAPALSRPAGAVDGERAAQVLGIQVARGLFAVGHADEPVRIEGLIGRPHEARSRADRVYLYVGGRPVRDRRLQQALVLGYRGALEKGRWPVAIVALELPADQVDVNVHPQKHEVRFRDARGVFDALRRAVGKEVARAPWALAHQARPTAAGGEAGAGSGAVLLPPEPVQARLPLTRGGAQSRSAEPPATYSSDGVAPEDPVLLPGPPGEGEGFFTALRWLGQVRRTYLVCEGPSGIFLVDQHAAHERVMFEEIRRGWRARGNRVQQLLVPVQVDLEPELVAVAAAAEPLLRDLGLEVEHFGGNTWVVKGVPAVLSRAGPEALLRDTLSHWADDTRAADALEARAEAVAARMACHAAVRAGDPMSGEEVVALFRRLDGVDNRGHCPHGRPTFVELSWTELERRIHRQY